MPNTFAGRGTQSPGWPEILSDDDARAYRSCSSSYRAMADIGSLNDSSLARRATSTKPSGKSKLDLPFTLASLNTCLFLHGRLVDVIVENFVRTFPTTVMS